jgi:hypothetical protein
MASYGQVFRGHIKIEIVQLKSIDFMTKNYCKDRKLLKEFAGALNYHPYRPFQREKLRKLRINSYYLLMRKCQPLFRRPRPRGSPPMLTQRDQLLSQNKIRLKMSILYI